MFPSCKRAKTDSSEFDDSNEWLRNISFKPDIKKGCTGLADGETQQTPKRTEISRSPIVRQPTSGGTQGFTIDRSADRSNLGASRSYFKTVPIYQVTSECSNSCSEENRSGLKESRYFRHSCIRKERKNLEVTAALPDTDRFSTSEWISLWVREQEDLRKTAGSRDTRMKRLSLILGRLISFGKRYPNRLEPRLRLVEFEIRKQLGESSSGDLYATWRRELRSRPVCNEEWMLCLRFGLASNTLHLRDIRKDFKEIVAIQLTNIEDCKAGTYRDYENLLDALFFYALTMSDAGYHELGTGIYQALIDFNIGRWVAQKDLSIELYKRFWLSGQPRLGELGYVDWAECSDRDKPETAKSFTQNVAEPFHIDKDLSVPLQWLQNEFTRERADILPFRVKSDYLEDLERYVGFNDLILFSIPLPAIQRMLILMVTHLIIVASPFGLCPLTSPVLTALLECVTYMYDVINRFPSVSTRFASGCSTPDCSTAFIGRLLDQLIERTKQRPEMQKALLLFKMSLGISEAKSILATNRHNGDLFASYLSMYPSASPTSAVNTVPQIVIALSENESCLSNVLESDFDSLLAGCSEDDVSEQPKVLSLTLLRAIAENRIDVFRAALQDLSASSTCSLLHVKCRRFLKCLQIMLSLGRIPYPVFNELAIAAVQILGDRGLSLYDPSLSLFLIERLSSNASQILTDNSVLKQWLKADWIAQLMYLYWENDRLRVQPNGQGGSSLSVSRLGRLFDQAAEGFFPECTLIHRLRSQYSTQFLPDVESELRFTSSRLRLPFNKTLHLDHLRWVSLHCRNRPEFDWKSIVRSIENDRGLRIKLPLAEFEELRLEYN